MLKKREIERFPACTSDRTFQTVIVIEQEIVPTRCPVHHCVSTRPGMASARTHDGYECEYIAHDRFRIVDLDIIVYRSDAGEAKRPKG